MSEDNVIPLFLQWHISTVHLTIAHILNWLSYRSPIGSLWATSSTLPFVTRPTKSFVNKLIVTTSPFNFFTLKDLKRSWFSFHLLLYIQVPHTHTHTHTHTQVLWVNTVSGTSCCSRKLYKKCNFMLICAHFSKMYIWAYIMANYFFMNKYC
jgi:hypothetical protein